MRKRKITMWILGGLSAMTIGALSFAWPELGRRPSGEHKQRIMQSPNYDTETQRFVNRRQVEYDKMMNEFDYVKLSKEQFLGKEIRAPQGKLPQQQPDIEQFLAAESMQYHWLGHSTVLMRIDQISVLIDPVFTNAAPLPFVVPRFEEPILALDELPEIDLILISHDHYDHLDRRSIQHFRDRDTKFIVPLGLSSYLIGWGIEAERIQELDWWDESSFEGLKIACTPSQHFSGRNGPRGNATLWASWVVIGEEERFYFSGDSGYDIHFKQIGDKYGPFDVAFMESGQYNAMWKMSHLHPEDTVQASEDIQAKKIQPIHWGMFTLSTHDWFEPPEQILKGSRDKEFSVLTPVIGERVCPKEQQEFSAWWREL